MRYLRASRKQTVISIVTVISILGVAAGVMALIIALAVTNGYRGMMQRTLLGATAHISILEKEPGEGIKDWRSLTQKLSKLPYVTSSAPVLYGTVFYSGRQGAGGVLKGVDLSSPGHRASLARTLKEGSIEDLAKPGPAPGLIIGARLAQSAGVMLGSRVTVISPQGEMTPLGMKPAYFQFRVVGIFRSDFYDLDAFWAFSTMENVQRVLGVGDVANSVELHLSDIGKTPEVTAAAEKSLGPDLGATNWMEQNRDLLNALRIERTMVVLVISLIQLVAALNILISLTMMVMEKHRDIALMMSMGARAEQIRRIFVFQGLIIGGAGTVIGLVFGYALSYLADHYRWLRMDEQVYSLSYLPFEPRWADGIWVAAVAMGVSLLATLYPARSASRILPAEALRYE
jgi:lipoprotein-releasing system permease protein